MSTASDMLTTIDTAISAIVSGRVESITIEGDQYTSLNISDLYALKEKYANEVGREDAIANDRPPFGIIGMSAGSAK